MVVFSRVVMADGRIIYRGRPSGASAWLIDGCFVAVSPVEVGLWVGVSDGGAEFRQLAGVRDHRQLNLVIRLLRKGMSYYAKIFFVLAQKLEFLVMVILLC